MKNSRRSDWPEYFGNIPQINKTQNASSLHSTTNDNIFELFKDHDAFYAQRKFSWNQYFLAETIDFEKTNDGTALFDTSSSSNYYIHHCLFENCKENGAIYIQRNDHICTLIEECVFYNCSSTLDGGSVYYVCQGDGQFVQQRTCYYKSKATNSYIAFWQIVSDYFSHLNQAIDVSIYNCGENETKGAYTFSVACGSIIISRINSTYNKCSQYSSIESDFNQNECACEYSIFRENNQTESNSLRFICSDESINQRVHCCNVIGNKCGTDNDQVLFYCCFAVNVDHCIFRNNIAKYMFKQEYEGYPLTISDSYVDNNSTAGSGNVIFINETRNYDFNNFSYFNMKFCSNAPKGMSIKLSYLSKFAKTASASLFSSKK